MKPLTALLLSAVTFIAPASAAQERPELPFQLYLGCLRGTLMASYDITPTRVGISEFVNQLDDNCVAWTLIWYPALSGKLTTSIPQSELQKFARQRGLVLGELTRQLKSEALR